MGLFVPFVPVDVAIVLTGSGGEVLLAGADDFVAFAAVTEQVLLVLEHHHPHCGLLISLLLHCNIVFGVAALKILQNLI